jgi:hypothetical protein
MFAPSSWPPVTNATASSNPCTLSLFIASTPLFLYLRSNADAGRENLKIQSILPLADRREKAVGHTGELALIKEVALAFVGA